jgi:ribosomal protein L39E
MENAIPTYPPPSQSAVPTSSPSGSGKGGSNSVNQAMPQNKNKAAKETKREARLLKLNREIEPEWAMTFLGREIVENEDERDYVLWETEQNK